MQTDARVAIVGGGLAGLFAARLLAERGVRDWLLVEARDVFGGRIASVPAGAARTTEPADGPATTARIDLGPTWFWPALQPELDGLVEALGLARFAQHEAGDTLLERAAGVPPARVSGFVASPPSMRIAGGMGALVEAVRRGLDTSRLLAGHRVERLRRAAGRVALDISGPDGAHATLRAERVLLAVPPRLAAARIAFEPALPEALSRAWRDTPTWMAPHAKYVAVYDTAFWRAQGLSGAARSAAGPLAEIHDASVPNGPAALFGFVGVPARARARVPADVLEAHCRAQLARLFGPAAASPAAQWLRDWAVEPFTATEADLDAPAAHAVAPPTAAAAGDWHDCLVGVASEWSPRFPGYLAGAIEAARVGVGTMATR